MANLNGFKPQYRDWEDILVGTGQLPEVQHDRVVLLVDHQSLLVGRPNAIERRADDGDCEKDVDDGVAGGFKRRGTGLGFEAILVRPAWLLWHT